MNANEELLRNATLLLSTATTYDLLDSGRVEGVSEPDRQTTKAVCITLAKKQLKALQHSISNINVNYTSKMDLEQVRDTLILHFSNIPDRDDELLHDWLTAIKTLALKAPHIFDPEQTRRLYESQFSCFGNHCRNFRVKAAMAVDEALHRPPSHQSIQQVGNPPAQE